MKLTDAQALLEDSNTKNWEENIFLKSGKHSYVATEFTFAALFGVSATTGGRIPLYREKNL